MTKSELSTTGEKFVKVGKDAFKDVKYDVTVKVEAPENELLARASQLNKLSEVSQVALGMCLVKIKEGKAYEPTYKSWEEYYRTELGRQKSDISKLLTVGRFMLEGGFPQETEAKYTVLYSAIKAFPDKDPKYILSTAQSNTLHEIELNRRDDAFGDHTPVLGEERWGKCVYKNKHGDLCGDFHKV